DEPTEFRVVRQAASEQAAPVNAGRRPASEEYDVVTDEGVADVPDVAREVYEDCDERAELYDGDGRGYLLRVERLRESRRARREDQARGRADGDELRQPLNDAEYDGLKNIHLFSCWLLAVGVQQSA